MAGRVALVINPSAGRGRAARVVPPVTERLEASGATVQVLTGRDREDSLALCVRAVAEGASALVAAGGDGMVHLAVQAVAGTATPLGIIPVGTGNDFATCLGLPHDIEGAADIVAAGVST
ncbi:MAG: acylglycerol kinase family protein, partial [Mycobacteriales bacterium]